MLRGSCAVLVFASLVACHGGQSSSAAAPPAPQQPAEHSLSGLAAQHIAVLPTYAVRVMPGLAWSIGRPIDVERSMDAEIASAFEERGLRRQWVFPEDLESSYRRNSTYASDPYALAEEPLRSLTPSTENRIPEPLASQLRTLIALRDDVRYVLAPVELRLEPAGAGMGRAVLKVVLIDARGSSMSWTGEFSSEPAPTFGPALAATIASRLAAAVAPQ